MREISPVGVCSPEQYLANKTSSRKKQKKSAYFLSSDGLLSSSNALLRNALSAGLLKTALLTVLA